MRMIKIEVIGKGKALAKLDDRNPKIRESLLRALPMEGIASLWGDEIYFDVPLQMENENPSLKHSSEAFYALDDPLGAAIFSVLVEM